jgi:hypothetical protein
MMHHPGDALVSVLAGSATALLAHAANLVEAASLGGELLSTVLYGFIGGAAGYMGRLLIDHLKNRKRTNPKQ